MGYVESLLRWAHVVAGIAWVGMIFFVNWVNAHFIASLDPQTRKRVVPELMPRVAWWFRGSSLWTFATGVLLLGLVYHAGGALFRAGEGWGMAASVMSIAVYAGGMLYDVLMRTPLKNSDAAAGAVGIVLIAIFAYLFSEWAGFSYRATLIHVGILLGTAMAMNVWMRIWPAQRDILAALKAGNPPPPERVALVAVRARHNAYMSVPLVWTMLNQHTTPWAGLGWIGLVGFVAIGWVATYALFRKSATAGIATTVGID